MRCLSLLMLAALPGLPSASSITVQNPSFETGDLTQIGNGTFSQLIANSTIFAQGGTIGSWTASSTTTGAAAGAFDPSPGGVNWATSWWTGNNIGYVQISALGTVSLSQVLADDLLDNTTYTLSAQVGRRSFTPVFSCSMQLRAGATVLDSVACPVLAGGGGGTSGTQTLTYASGAANPLSGQPLSIALASTHTDAAGFQEAFWDNVPSLRLRPPLASRSRRLSR